MKSTKFFSIAGLIIIHILATMINFTFFIDKITPSKWINLMTTLLYIGYWFAFAFISKHNTSRLETIICIILIIVSLGGFVISRYSLDIGAFIPIALLIVTPFAGVQAIINAPYAWLVILAFSTVWMFIGLKKIKE